MHLRKLENAHIALWLLKDTCWVMDLHVPGLVMIAPTLALAIFITARFRRYTAELFHNIAVCLWITANSVWMIGEFFYDDGLRPYATVLFVAGLITVAYYYLFLSRKEIRET
ncbi:hypothetical protein [Hufsiella ginkgonis]|uniref:Uncharacterized protein n=1 Tax=Hufsiella ginkgonis TaxID=2695274 RepID=A0A7K1XY26_9SPHI|nr:hypothetical protein [Hufsiella ginkgonis]MXV15843.1 hypothetical protein [Hufsiella ginkgonis]